MKSLAILFFRGIYWIWGSDVKNIFFAIKLV